MLIFIREFLPRPLQLNNSAARTASPEVDTEGRAAEVGVDLDPDPFVISDSVDGSEPWRPGAVTLYFGRLRKRVGLDHIQFHSLRKFMETYGQDLGFAPSQVAMRAGHDPSVAAKHYTGKIAEADRAIADGISGLLLGGS